MSEPNLRHFLALAEVASAGTLSAAAERVNLSQSALSQGLKRFERLAGEPLFARSRLGLNPTPAGRCLIRRSGRAVELLRSLERDALRRGRPEDSHRPLGEYLTSSQLRSVIAIVENGGYSVAARALGVSQPTVYHAARELQSLVGTPLFERVPRGVRATPLAESIARTGRLIFAEVRQGFDEVSELRGQTDSRIAVGSLPLARVSLLPRAITTLLKKYPDARVSVVDGPYSEQLRALRYGHIDWIIGALRTPSPANDVVQESLFQEALSVIVRANHPWLGERRLGAQSLSKLEWIAPREGTPARELFVSFFERQEVPPPQRVIECSSLVATRSLLQLSQRAALLSPSQIQWDIESGQLAVLETRLPATTRSIGITTRVDWQPTRVQAEFTAIVRQIGTDQ